MSSTTNTNTNTKTTTTSTTTKTVYLIRHAESEENRRLGSLKTSVKGLGKFTLPKKEDVVASVQLLNVCAQLDSDVSPKGQKQVSLIDSLIH